MKYYTQERKRERKKERERERGGEIANVQLHFYHSILKNEKR